MRRWIAAMLVAGIVAGCSPATQPSATSTATVGASSPSSSPSTALPTTPVTSGPPPTPSPSAAESCADRTFDALTEAQRIGQLFMVGLKKDQLDPSLEAAIAGSHFGSVAFTKQSAAGVAAVRTLTNAVQALATRAATGRIGFFVAANQEGGLIQGLSGPGFDTIPSALDQGAMTPEALQRKAARWGRELVDAGVNLDLAPVADVVPPGTDAKNAPIGQLDREYGHDPAAVASHVTGFIAGMAEAGVATSAKHYPGLGRVAGNTDVTGDVVDDVTTRHDRHLEPFARAVDAGVPFVMVSLATYERLDPDHLAVFSPTVIREMLRGDLGFRGVVISDALGATAVASIAPATRAIDFVQAGGDVIISNQVPPAIEMAQALADRAARNDAFRARIDDAARRVLDAKAAAGLLPCGG